MRKLTDSEIKILQGFKGMEDGKNKFFDMLEQIYKDDYETLKEIHDCREKKDGAESVMEWNAYQKSEHYFYEFMDDLLNKIGYRKK